MKRIIFSLALGLFLTGQGAAQSPAPISVGAVRDQTGEPIAGARIRFLDARGTAIWTSFTQSDGTFAVSVTDSTSVRITCAFCREQRFPMLPDQPFVAVVQRYHALMNPGLSPEDVAALPYAHAESALSLQPYVVLSDSSAIIPGPQLSDRGLSRAGGLVVDHGVPDYDVVANISPFLVVPSRSMSDLHASDAAAAFRYGDRADAGTFTFAPGQMQSSALVAAGDDTILRTHAGSPPSGADASFSSNQMERRTRVDLDGVRFIPDGTVAGAAVMSRGVLAPFPNDRIAESFDSARISVEVVRAQRRYAHILFDHATYGIARPTSRIDGNWSDAEFRAGLESLGSKNGFVEVAARRSNGYYNAEPRIPELAAALNQLEITTGVRSHSAVADFQAAVGAFEVTYSGGPYDPEYASKSTSAGAEVATPSLTYTYHPGDRWNVAILAASTFRLPTFVERFGIPPAGSTVLIDRNGLLQTTISFTDNARMRASLTAYRQNTRGLDTGSVCGVGAALAWQVTPALSVRSWVLRETDTTAPSQPALRFTPNRLGATVGSLWLSYEASRLRVDAIYRRDLLDKTGVSHLDYSISSALSDRVRWFGGSELRHGARYVDIGLRFNAP